MWLLLAACAHVVSITSFPAGASISHDAGAARAGEVVQVGTAPVDLTVPRFRATTVTAALPGYQTLDARVRPRWWRQRTVLELRLSVERDPLQ